MGKKGKKKPASAGEGSGEPQASAQPQQQPVVPVVTPPVQQQPQQQPPPVVEAPSAEPASEPQSGKKGKGKKGKPQQQPVEQPPSEPQPQVQVAAQPADVAQEPAVPSQPTPGPGKRKVKQQQRQQQQQQQEQPTPPPSAAPAPALAAGRGRGQPPFGRGQAPPQQQTTPAPAPVEPAPAAAPAPAWGAGQGQQPGGRGQPPFGRGQTPPRQQPASGPVEPAPAAAPAPAWGAGQGQHPGGRGQQPGGRGQPPFGRGQTPPRQQPASGPVEPAPAAAPAPAWGAGQGQHPGGRGQQPGGRGQPPFGRGQTPPRQQPASGPVEPAPAAAPAPAWGAGQGQHPGGRGQQPGGRGQPPFGRGQTPPRQQPAYVEPTPVPAPAWGAGRGQPQGRGREQTPPQQPQMAGRGQGPPQQQQAGRGAGRGRGAAAGPPRSRQVSETSESSVGSGRRPPPSGGDQSGAPRQAMEQMHIHGAGDQRTPRPQQAVAVRKPSELKPIPRRKNLGGGGTRGQPITVQTNHLALKINPKFEIAVHYDVAISPDKPKKMMRPVWEEFYRQNLSKYAMAFDDVRNAYSPSRLPTDIAGSVLVAEDAVSKAKEYKVVVRFAAEVNLRALFSYMESGCVTAVPQEALQCIDIVLRNASALKFVRVGRSYFSEPQGQIISLGDGLELWHGFFQSAVIGWKPFLNVDVAHKGFPKPQPVMALFNEMSQSRDRDTLERDDVDRISKFMKSLKVEYEIPRQPASKKRYRVNSLVDNPVDAMFVLQDGTRISVFNYFAQIKGYTIQHRRMPCLWVGPKDRKIFLPPELCTILSGQVINRKLNDVQTSNMVRNAATNTDRRKQKIMDSLRAVRFNDDPVVRAFGLNVGTEFERIRARWLQPPALEYKNAQQPVRPSRGVWRASEFLQAQNLPATSWTVINLDRRRTRDDSLSSFARTLQQSARGLGMEVGAPDLPFPFLERFDERQFQELLRRNKQKRLLFVVVPDYPTNIYSKVKQAAELVVGCLTQCIKSKTMFKMNPATVGNILLKVNAKLNGQNHTIAGNYRPPCLQVPCMIMGADVTHPSPDQTDIPSVAAVTASCDPRAFRYNFSWRLQPARQEIIDDLETIVKEQLFFFFKQSGQKPQRLIFFRDGVSEGQFQEVMNMEVQAIRRACAALPGDYRPPITFLVVQKRHHTRFFPTSSSETEDRNSNVRAGTVVDTDITHPTDLEYYLVSHASIQGVARPTKYRVLWDDSNMGEDELEALTYYLCHMFSRCTRSVSYPAPTYYAHLAAFRARVYLEGRPINLENLQLEQQRRIIRDEILRGLPMFFV